MRISTCRCAHPPLIVRVGWFKGTAPLFLLTADGVVWVLVTNLRPEQLVVCMGFFHGGPRRTMRLLEARSDRLRVYLGGGSLELTYRVATEQERGLLEGMCYRMAAEEEPRCWEGCVVG